MKKTIAMILFVLLAACPIRAASPQEDERIADLASQAYIYMTIRLTHHFNHIWHSMI